METINTPSQAIIKLSEIGNTMQFESDAGGDAALRAGGFWLDFDWADENRKLTKRSNVNKNVNL